MIVGPRADKLQPDPQGSGFSLGSVDESLPSRTLRTGPPRPTLLLFAYLGKATMAWTTPTLVEICIGLEINGYLPAEF